MWREKKADALPSKGNCDAKFTVSDLLTPKSKTVHFAAFEAFCWELCQASRGTASRNIIVSQTGTFFHRCTSWKSKFWLVVWFHFSYSVILYAQEAAMSCGIWQRSRSDGLVIWKREAASVPYSHCCHYQPSGEYYLWSFLYLLLSKSAVSLRYSAPKCLLVQARKILILKLWWISCLSFCLP